MQLRGHMVGGLGIWAVDGSTVVGTRALMRKERSLFTALHSKGRDESCWQGALSGLWEHHLLRSRGE